ncbi:MAG TPA: AAA domain-containing protein [Candidatus Polarisedimenticolaceae bacterium]|nr:AAA domain-containing protein [Candidatus Polarisedimenticolaceae bacterium]
MSAGLLDRLEALLHREHYAIHTGHRELMAMPIDERVDRGDSLSELVWDGEADGEIRLRCGDNLAKYRSGDPLRLANVDAEERGAGAGVVYASFHDASGTLIVRRDPFRPGGTFDPLRPLRLDPEVQSLTALALEALGRVRGGRSGASITARAVLEGAAERVVDENARTRALAAAGAAGGSLDASQREAFVEAMSARPVALVQGPPGTGKTHVLARIVRAFADSGRRVLVTAYTHRAVNQALRKIVETGTEVPVIKAGKSDGADDLRGTRVVPVPSMKKVPKPNGRGQIVGTTIFGARAAWEAGTYDVVVVDEAAQVPLTFAACALLAAERYVLIGDHRQLGPIVQGRHADPLAGSSLFGHAAASYPPVVLETTYRMNEALNAFPSRMFYGGRLVASPATAAARFPATAGGPFDDLFDPERPAVLALVSHEGFRMRCPAEARLVADLVLDRIVRQRGDPRQMAVVSPYRAQLRLIRTLIRRGLDAAGVRCVLPVIDTVERIQGQERELVIVSLAGSDPDYLGGDAASFFFAPARLNVTLTRARTKLIVVGSPLAFEAFPKTLAGLAGVERFRRLRRELPAVDCTARATPA